MLLKDMYQLKIGYYFGIISYIKKTSVCFLLYLHTVLVNTPKINNNNPKKYLTKQKQKQQKQKTTKTKTNKETKTKQQQKNKNKKQTHTKQTSTNYKKANKKQTKQRDKTNKRP